MKKTILSLARSVTMLVLLAPAAEYAAAEDRLWIQDPRSWWKYGQGTIEQAVLSVRPAGIYMEYGLYLTFSGRGNGFLHADTMEAQFTFELPEASIVCDSWLWIGDTIIRGEIMDKWTAESIYEDIVNRRRDPSILFKRSATQYELRIYPMLGDESRKVKITYLVPAGWNAQQAFAPLPAAMIRTSKNPVTGLSILTTPGGEWNNPSILERSELGFEAAFDSINGNYMRVDVPWSVLAQNVSIAFDAPLTGGFYVNRHETGGGGYYQLAVLPSAALDLHSSRKTAILFDNTEGNSGVTSAEVLSAVQTTLFTTFTARDSFNLIFSTPSIDRASDRWLAADSATVDSVFASLDPEPFAPYSNLPALLADAVEFVQENHGGEIVLISNSDNFGASIQANQLIDDILGLMPVVTPIHVVEYQDRGFSYHWIGGRSYYGNEYFHTNLTRLTGGNYSSMRIQWPSAPFRPFPDVIAGAFQAVGGFINSFDLHTTVQAGFCYSRVNVARSASAPVYLDRPFLQTGRYYGSFPLTVEISGMYHDSVFNKEVALYDAVTSGNDSLSAESWAGNYIAELEKQTQTNDVVSEIVATSVRERVLSIYSAFLCLEPSRGGEVCYDCLDESGEIVGVEEDSAAADTTGDIGVFPNPFNASTTIRVRLPRSAPGDASLAIYDVLGRKVRDFDLSAGMAAGRVDVTWNGTGEDGAAVNSGVYFAVYRTPERVQTLKLMLLK